MLLRKCDWISLVNVFVKSYWSHMVIVITLVFISEGYRFSVLKSTMIWPIVQETVLNFVGSPSAWADPIVAIFVPESQLVLACPIFLRSQSLRECVFPSAHRWGSMICDPFIVPCQGCLNVSSSSSDVYWFINPQPSFHFYLSLCNNIYLDQSRIQRRHVNTTFQLSSNRWHCNFLPLHPLPSMIPCTIA